MMKTTFDMPVAVSTEAATSSDVESIKARFVHRYPDMLRMASYHHRFLRSDLRDDAVADTVAFAWRYYLNMAKKGKDPDRVLGSIVRYSAGHVRAGRKIGHSPDAHDALSNTGERRFTHLPDHKEDAASAEAHAAMRSRLPNPAAEAISELDYQAFLESLSPADRHLAESLVAGSNESDVAKQRGVSHQAVNLRKKVLAKKWACRDGYCDPLSR